ncbi:hypothetical protein HN412_03765 [archaeon]|jgi:hypothetical protein|nr:hypothetical protein [archaeon]MBT7192674.1 hypothetical protein [archaeon]MBT7297856.1 hypothetical protein [archaeon]
MVEPSRHYLEKIEYERGIRLPSCIFNHKGINTLDKFIKTKNPDLYSYFYKNFERYLDTEPFSILSSKLNEKRKISEEDIKFIKKLSLVFNIDPNLFFDYLGNVFYVTSIIDTLSSNKEIPKIIEISSLLYVFNVMIELSCDAIAQFLLTEIKNKNKDKKFTDFTRCFKDKEHPTIGKTIQTAKRLTFISNQEETMFYKNKLIRNKISHANLFFDEKSDKIYSTSGKEYKVEELNYAILLLKNFMFELLLNLNKGETDLLKSIKLKFNQLSSEFRRIGRAGPCKKRMNSYCFEWEKKK